MAQWLAWPNLKNRKVQSHTFLGLDVLENRSGSMLLLLCFYFTCRNDFTNIFYSGRVAEC